MQSPNFEKTLGWYREMLGFRCSDDVYADSKDNIVGSFNRLDRGDDYVDHHAFFCIRSDKAGLNHLSYEAADIDDIMIGHEHMKSKGYEHFWGIGRHSLGSQVFDYWGDPWGRVHEHWADTDVLNASMPAQPDRPARAERPVGRADPGQVHGPRGALTPRQLSPPRSMIAGRRGLGATHVTVNSAAFIGWYRSAPGGARQRALSPVPISRLYPAMSAARTAANRRSTHSFVTIFLPRGC